MPVKATMLQITNSYFVKRESLSCSFKNSNFAVMGLAYFMEGKVGTKLKKM